MYPFKLLSFTKKREMIKSKLWFLLVLTQWVRQIGNRLRPLIKKYPQIFINKDINVLIEVLVVFFIKEKIKNQLKKKNFIGCGNYCLLSFSKLKSVKLINFSHTNADRTH